jgi:hypothetical protein
MTNLFNGDGSDQNQNQNNAQPDLATLLAGIKNEQGGQKYTSIEDALKGGAHAQAYIRELQEKLAAGEAEKVRLAGELSKAANIDDVVSKLASQLQTQQASTNQSLPQGLNEEAVLGLVRKSLEQQKQQDAAQQNLNLVQQELSKKFGEKAKDAIAEKARELNTSPEQLGALAATSPQLVLQLFGTQANKTLSASTSSVNIPPLNGAKEKVKAPDYSLLAGPQATLKNQIEFLKKIRDEVFDEFEVTKDSMGNTRRNY